MVPNLFWNCKKYTGCTYVMLKVIFVFDFDNVVFVKLAIGWVGVGGCVVLAEHKEWLGRAIQ